MNTGNLNVLSKLTAYIIDKLQDNIMVNAFRIAINGSLTQFNMIDGIVDEYEDESGIDTVNSVNEQYSAGGNAYSPTGGIPSSEYASDTYTKLLLHMNGVDASTTFTDDGNTGHTVTANGNAQIDTAQKVFGTASGLFDGTNDYLTIPDSTDWDFGSGDFTIDFWVYVSAFSPTTQFIFYQGTDGFNFYDCSISSSGIITFRLFETSLVVNLQSSASISTGTWYHVAIIRGWGGNANDWAITVDGNQSGSTVTASNAIANYTSTFSVGGKPPSSTLGLNGWLDEFRVSKGIARWTANFNTFDNMTLISNSFTAEAVPDTARIVLLEEDVDTITLNTDLKAYASRDGGASYVQGTLTDEGDYDTAKRILVADFDLTQSGIGSGVDMEYKLETLNNKQMNIHASSLNWD